ncbi:neutral amino acid transporter [Actinomortierella ambigua]|uniref:Neutral amino acid transporter n=1 Tax=Actinomortierella ambigua TaxID=1343610 RepID=A0A9P6Q4U6_9FUNG|nr:neutral amino acid transporter [Actinomortierella ambigua]
MADSQPSQQRPVSASRQSSFNHQSSTRPLEPVTRGRSPFLNMTSSSGGNSNPSSRPNSRPTSRSRPGSRPGSRPVSWLVQTNTEYANMFETYGGDHSHEEHRHEGDASMTEKGAQAPRSRPASILEKYPTFTGKAESMHSDAIEVSEDYTYRPREETEEEIAKRTVGPWKAAFLLGKAFVGTGVLFLPKAFLHGGLAFSCFMLAFVAVICTVSFLMLVKVRLVIRESFGDMGLVLYGKWMRLAILVAVAISQIGFCCAYLIFVSQNIDAIVQTFTRCTFTAIEPRFYILLPLIVLIPLVLIRRMSILSFPSMVSNVFIVLSIVYLWYYTIDSVVENGVGPNLSMFNGEEFAMFIGTAVFSYEGIGLVIPITESMAEPEKFPKVLAMTIAVVTLFFMSVGALGYLAFGSNTQTIVILNLPVTSGWTIAIQILYSLAIILSVPLMLSPASKILEQGIFGDRSGGQSNKIKMLKNLVRTLLIIVCALVSFGVGAKSLDKFVSFVGAAFCVPLCFIFPAMFHYKVCAKNIMTKIFDVILGLFGLVAMIFTVYITIRSWVVESTPDADLDRCAVFQ